MRIIRRYSLPMLALIVAVTAFENAAAQIVFKRNKHVTAADKTISDARRPVPSAQAGSVTAKVSWSGRLGLPPLYPGSSEPYPSPCGLIVISIHNLREKIRASEGGTHSIQSRGDDRDHVCSYSIEGLPKDLELRVNASFIDTRVWETAPWISTYSTDGAQPGHGQIRMMAGGTRLTLSDSEPNASVDFNIRYETPRRPIKIF